MCSLGFNNDKCLKKLILVILYFHLPAIYWSLFLLESFEISSLPPSGQQLKIRPVKQTQRTFFTAAISKFIEIDCIFFFFFVLQIIVKLIFPLNMEFKSGFNGNWTSPNIKNRRLMVDCKNVFVISTTTKEKKTFTRALHLPKTKTGVKTGQFFDYLTHFVTNTGLI